MIVEIVKVVATLTMELAYTARDKGYFGCRGNFRYRSSDRAKFTTFNTHTFSSGTFTSSGRTRACYSARASFEVLRARQTTATLPSRKRLAPGDDTTITKPTRVPLLRRVGSFVASGGNLDSKNQGQVVKESPTRYADKLFNQNTKPERQQPPRYQISRDSFRFTSEIEPLSRQLRSRCIASTGISAASEQHPPSFQRSVRGPPVENNSRMLFQRMASRSMRKLEIAVQDSIPAARASIADRRGTFQRTHSQSLRTMADALSPHQRPRTSMTSTQTRVLKRMSSFVSEGQLSSKRSPTRYADELFRRKSIKAPNEEGWEPK
ncbi:hypothetical protein GQ600_22722 [Phytophthora cactorum]|nr:hypothetical protein GQ600_22722 [Phytophthora cactorum]